MKLNDLEILENSRFANGKRHFVENLPYANCIKFSLLNSTVPCPAFSILVTAFYRTERLTLCLSALNLAIQRSAIPCEMFVVETSITPVNYATCEEQARVLKCSIKYLHNPFITQSEARNIAINSVASSSSYLLLLDCDIYVSENSIYSFWKFLEQEKSVSAISPTINASTDIGPVVALSGKRLLPDEHVLLPQNSDLTDFQPTRMLRGIYVLRKSHYQLLLRCGVLFSPHFVVWQNVPFFQTLREMGFLCGYVPASLAFAIHDERPDSARLANSMPDWSPQTLKSICLLIHRNCLWREQFAVNNGRFLRRLHQIVSRHSSKSPSEIIALLMDCASYINEANWPFFEEYIAMKIDLECEPGLNKFLLVLLSERQSWPDYRNILSLDLNIAF